MVIKLARNSGFCFGVKRAINIAMDAARENNSPVTLGPIIHNPQMVKKLKESGVEHINSVSEINGYKAVIIRSHGVTREVLDYLNNSGVKIIDATCPYVSKTQQCAKKLHDKGFKVIILGNKEHPEVIALQSYANNEAIIVARADELPADKYPKLGIISQTTQTEKKFKELVANALDVSNEIYVYNTICSATSVRQQSTRELAQNSDIMFVIGGRNSSNTKMLARICEEYVKTYHIETADEIKSSWIEDIGCPDNLKLGITAGASTPDWIILDVYNKIIKYIGARDLKAYNVEDIPGYKEE